MEKSDTIRYRLYHFCLLFVSDSLYRVHVGGFLRRKESEEYADERTYSEAHYNAPRLDVCLHVQNVAYERCYSYAKQDSYHAARNTEHCRFDKELIQNVLAASADRHSQTDFLCSLGNRYIHDVHDSDAADQK